MYNRVSILILSIAIAASSSQVKAQERKRPNVLMIAVDDLKPLLGCYGATDVFSPNIDALAAKGTVFMKNYCQQAVCAPTRASLLTGLRPDRTRVWDLKTLLRAMVPDVLTLPQYFQQQGYITTGIGKVYDSRSVDKMMDSLSWSLPYQKLNDGDYAKGYDKPRGHYQSKASHDQLDRALSRARAMGLTYKQIDSFMDKHRVVVEAADVPDDAYSDGAIARKAGRMLEGLSKGNKPFFLAVGFTKPHLPFVAPQKYWDLYDRGKIQLAPFQSFAKGSPEFAYQPSGELVSNYILSDDTRFKADYALQTPEVQRLLIHGYLAALSYMDVQVGYLLNALKQSGLDKNTIVVLWGDHGWHLGDHGIWNKHTNFEQATRAPLIISAPGYTEGNKVNGLTEFVDVFPTLCDLAGIKIPSGLAGTSLLPMIKDPNITVKQVAQSQYPRGENRMGYALRSDRYRCVFWFEEKYRLKPVHTGSKLIAIELYDYLSDPLETTNRADDPAYADVISDMKKRLSDYLAIPPSTAGTLSLHVSGILQQ